MVDFDTEGVEEERLAIVESGDKAIVYDWVWVRSQPKGPCRHLTGYWIKEGVSFRCYACQCQFQLADLPHDRFREIEVWPSPLPPPAGLGAAQEEK